MDEQTARRLERLRHYHTRYEVVITNGRDTYLLWFSERGRTIKDLWNAIHKRAPHLLQLLQNPNQRATQDGHTIRLDGTDWIVKASGRTQREAILGGEHPFICDAFPLVEPVTA